MRKLFLLIALSGCTLSYDADDKACLIHFSPTGEQIEAFGKACLEAVRVIRDEPAKIEIEDSEGI